MNTFCEKIRALVFSASITVVLDRITAYHCDELVTIIIYKKIPKMLKTEQKLAIALKNE